MFLIHWPHPYWVGPSEVRYVRKHRGGFNAICRSGISDTEAHQRNDGGQAFSLKWSEMPSYTSISMVCAWITPISW